MKTKIMIVTILFLSSLYWNVDIQASTSDKAPGFDHTLYAKVLTRYVDDHGRVNYKGLKADRQDLDTYVQQLARYDKPSLQKLSKEEQLAFWINAYNTLTLKVILDHYPIKASFFGSLRFPKNSIRQISGVWDKIQFKVVGQSMTLNDIEHSVIRKQFAEPRIHFALVCASGGCPSLRNEPFLGNRLDAQLDDQVKKLLSNPSKFKIDHAGKTIYLSKILDWYGDDFIARFNDPVQAAVRSEKQRAVINFLTRYVDEKSKKALLSYQYRIAYLEYDWSLNEQ